MFSIGVDLGGTTTSVGLVDTGGKIIDSVTFPTSTPSPEAWTEKVIKEIEILIAKNNAKGNIAGIGIGAPCANTVTGVIEAATDLPWKSPVHLVKLFTERVPYRVVITNDANAAAIGEMMYGAAKGLTDFILITLGTGVGAGIVCDGKLLSGKHGFAGELGHMRFSFAMERKCGCGRFGCLQTVASAKGIVETARLLLHKDSGSALSEIPENQLTSKTIAEAAEKGDKLAIEVFQFTGEALGKAMAEFAAISDPKAIILFGGVAKAGSLILEPAKKAFSENSLHLYKDNVEILISKIQESQSAVLGAASLPLMQ